MLSSATILVLSILIVLSCCIAETYTQKPGPFMIQVTSDEAVGLDYVADPYPMDNFNAYDVDLYVGNNHVKDSTYPYGIEIQDYGRPINIDLLSSIIKYFPTWNGFFTSWETPTVGGKPGIIGIIEKGGADKNGMSVFPGFVAAYSPDGYDNQGSIIVIIDAVADVKNFTEDKAMFEDFVKNIKILKTG
jgi:hypothetical protein